MIKGKHQYAVFNLSEGRLTYHPYWLAACSIPPSTKRLRNLWKTEENGLPRSPPHVIPPSCMMAEAKAADVCKPPDSATTTPGWWSWSSCAVSLFRCGRCTACAKDENVDLVQAEADLIDLILGFRMLKKSNTPSQVKYTGCLDDQLFYSYGQLGEKHQVVAWSCKGRLVQSTAAEHFFWMVEVIMDTPWDSFPKAWGSEWIDAVLSVHASIETTSVYNHIRWHLYW